MPAAADEEARQHRSRGSLALAGVVLCGGASTRMGVDKATISIEGATLLERALARLDTVCDPVLIAAGDIPMMITGRNTIPDAVRGAGPLAGLVAALRASPHRLLAVVAVDLPWIDPSLIRWLAAVIGEHDVAVCETTRGIEPLHAVYSTSLLEAAERAVAGPDRSLRRLIEGSDALKVPEREWRAAGISGRFTRNLNTPTDLAEFSQPSLR
ncbi:MAG: molybdenum cofactor guanylyltransferase [Candidatus Dormibacteria bacterium]